MFACTSGVMKEDNFTRVYLDSLRNSRPDMQFAINGVLEIEAVRDDVSASIFLDNAYREYLLHPQQAGEVISRYIASSSATLDAIGNETTVNPSSVFPVIRSKDFYDNVAELSDEDVILFEPYNDDLVVLYVEDTETSMSYLSEASIEGKIGRDTLYTFALANLKRELPEFEKHGEGAVYMLTLDGNYEASLLLFDEIWKKDEFGVSGDIVVAVPNRDLLMVTDSRDAEGVRQMKELADKQYSEGNHSISANLYKWSGSRFEVYKM